MKKIIAVMLFTASAILYLVPGSSFVQRSSDSLYVSAMLPGAISTMSLSEYYGSRRSLCGLEFRAGVNYTFN